MFPRTHFSSNWLSFFSKNSNPGSNWKLFQVSASQYCGGIIPFLGFLLFSHQVSCAHFLFLVGSSDLVLVPGCGGKPVQYKPSGDDGGLEGKVEARYFFSLCPTSLTIRDDMKACSGCLAINYANKDAQKKDWRRHKDVCKVLQPLGRSRRKNECIHFSIIAYRTVIISAIPIESSHFPVPSTSNRFSLVVLLIESWIVWASFLGLSKSKRDLDEILKGKKL